MKDTSVPKYRDHKPFWREGEDLQNFGDYLTPYFLNKLFLPVPRLPGSVRLVGSYLSEYHVGLAVENLNENTLPVRAPLIGWAGGLRDKDSLTPEAMKNVEILSLRGPLSAKALGRADQIPLGDPGLLLPALYDPKHQVSFSDRTLCVPHFNDVRSDEQIRASTGADMVLRPAIAADLSEIESFLDKLTSAEFVLCGSLHAAIASAAYGTPFAFWDSGEIDIPFKWQDFAASIAIECAFLPNIESGKTFYDSAIRNQKALPSMWPALAAAPYPIRPEALLRLVRYDLAKHDAKNDAYLKELERIFADGRIHQANLVADSDSLIQSLGAKLENFQPLLSAEQAESIRLRSRIDELDATGRDIAQTFQRALKEFAIAGDRQAEQLRRAYARPWRPFKRLIQRSVLRFALLFGGMMPEKRVRKINRSLSKRTPEHFLTGWSAAKERAWSEIPVALRPAVPAPPLKPQGSAFVFRALLTLAAICDPISKRRADRFRRSAKKRDPHRFRFDAMRDSFAAANSYAGPVADPKRARRVLVADYRLPRPDVSAGERATFGLISDLRALGMDVTFVATDLSSSTPYRQDIEALGAKVILRNAQYGSAGDYVRAEGAEFGAFYFIRVDVAEALLPSARAVAPDARIIFHAPDLYFLREGRAAELSGDPQDFAKAAQTEQRESAIMRAVDHVVLVSPAELPMVSQIVPREKISVFPALYSPVAKNPTGFADRRHMFFLGGFGHSPNLDAVLWFVDAIWPTIRAALPDVEFHIIGAEAPAEILELSKRPGVRVVGFVADLEAAMARYRISVAPLRYGAGIKGKLGAALGAGVPSVSTSIGSEGMGMHDGVHALVRDDSAAFAQAAIELYSNEPLWSRIAANGQKLVEDSFGNAANQSSFFRVLDKAGALPLDLYVSHCKALAPAALPDPDPALSVDVSIIIPVHNQWALTAACLNSVQLAIRGAGCVCEVILADDGSTDDTLQAATLYPGLRVVRQDKNLGFLRNCNAAAATARGRHLLLLNNDTIVLPGWLSPLMQMLDDDNTVAIAGSKLLYPDGTIQEAGAVLYADSTASNLGRGLPQRAAAYCFDREVDCVSGASILIRGSFWKRHGGFDTLYAPAYCEDTDLAMSARADGMRVVFAAASEAVHFEHGSYGEQTKAKPREMASTNGRKLLTKWRKQFEQDHLSPTTPPEIAAAHAERRPSAAALERRRSGKLNILYFSPFPSHPDSHGNQSTIQAFGKKFQRMGHKVHFALLDSTMINATNHAAMQSTWDTFDVLPNSHGLGSDGKTIPFDGWYEEGLGQNIGLLCAKYDIDVLFCSYIFQSKMLDYVPKHVLKVIDSHDKMADRYEMLRRNGQPLEFFSCTPEEEGAYMRRADVVVARRAEEATYFDSVTGRHSAVVIPHVEEPRFQQRSFKAMKNLGLVASANNINLAITLRLLQAIDARAAGAAVPFQLHIAGQIKSMIPNLRSREAELFSRPWVVLHGFVPDINGFYSDVDAVVSPVTMGTGINVKTVQAMAFGMPLVTTAWGIKGIETGHPMHLHADLTQLVDAVFELVEDPTQLEELSNVSRERFQRFYQTSIEAMEHLFSLVYREENKTGSAYSSDAPTIQN